jgi:3-oxoadipate enol-lactonase
VIAGESIGPDGGPDDGSVDRPVLVLGPSLGTRRTLFDRQVAGLRDRYRVILFDLPGHGASPAAPRPFLLEDVADDVVALLDDLGVDTFSFAGVSVSGAIGQAIALRHPDRVDSLVICSSAAHWPDQEQWRDRAERVRRDGVGFMVPSRLGSWFSAAFADREPERAKQLLGDLASTDAGSYAACCDAIRLFDARESLGEITAPTLVIVGDQDPATPPRLAIELRDGIPGSRLETIAGGLHLPVVEQAALVSTLIARHLERTVAPAKGTA